MKERSEVWEHFIKEELASGRHTTCKYCGMSYKCGAKKNGTSVLWAHISRCRKYPFNTPKDSKQSLLSFKSAKVPSGGTSGLTYHKFDAGSIRKALSFMDAFERYSEEDPHYVVDLNERDGKGSPDSHDWNNVRRFSEFLQAFYDMTLHVSGSLYVTSNLFFHELVSVVLLKDLVSSDDPDMCLMACRMKEKYEKYWGDPEKINLLIFIVVVLDPRYKLDYVQWMITEIYDPIVASKLVDNVKVTLNALYEEYRVSSSNDVNREEVSSSKDDKTPVSQT
uniref:BED-type domain-containing protein n=1 Tax=Chenopodium quinoa TaxID=63459 RepID=A0A803LJT2_CHEQI